MGGYWSDLFTSLDIVTRVFSAPVSKLFRFRACAVHCQAKGHTAGAPYTSLASTNSNLRSVSHSYTSSALYANVTHTYASDHSGSCSLTNTNSYTRGLHGNAKAHAGSHTHIANRGSYTGFADINPNCRSYPGSHGAPRSLRPPRPTSTPTYIPDRVATPAVTPSPVSIQPTLAATARPAVIPAKPSNVPPLLALVSIAIGVTILVAAGVTFVLKRIKRSRRRG